MINERNLLALLLLLLTTLQAAGRQDSLLWVRLQQTGIAYRQGLSDSALVQARRLLTVAEDTDDALAQAQLHSLIGFCLRDQGDQQSFAEELQKCISIGEANGFKEKAATSKHDLYVTAMLPAYSLLSVYYKDKKQTETGVNYAKKGMDSPLSAGQFTDKFHNYAGRGAHGAQGLRSHLRTDERSRRRRPQTESARLCFDDDHLPYYYRA